MGKPTNFHILMSVCWENRQESKGFWSCIMHYTKINPLSVS